MLETNEDNLKLLGAFKKYGVFKVIHFTSGLIISGPFTFIIYYIFSNLFTLNLILENSLYLTLSAIIFVLCTAYIITILIFISISFIYIYFGKKPEYLRKETVKKIYSRHYIPYSIILVFVLIVFLGYALGNNIFYFLFQEFLLI